MIKIKVIRFIRRKLCKIGIHSYEFMPTVGSIASILEHEEERLIYEIVCSRCGHKSNSYKHRLYEKLFNKK